MKRLVLAALVATAVAAPVSAKAAQPGTIWDNCTNYNHVFPHGVGRLHAHDHTSGTPVRNFLHSTVKYNIAMNHNSRLDGDKDGIACERA